MKTITATLFFISICLIAKAQFDQISVGAGYADAAFYSISDGATTAISHSDWDIAFSVGPQDLGVFINEGAASSTGALPPVELYLSTSTDFAIVDTSAANLQRLYNDEKGWSEGAFNHTTTPGDPFDFGWGSYNVMTHVVNGTRVFVIKLRNGSVKKLQIQSLAGGVYTFRYADPDGSNEVTQTVNKADFAGKTLAYYSFLDEEVRDLEPAAWDLVFTRYTTPLDDGEGNILQYMVTGVLSNAGVSVARVDGIDPATITYEDFDGSYVDTLAAIGHDWKEFNLSTFQWALPADRVYFVQTADSSIWKLHFVDFEGSTTGTITVEKTFQTSLISSAGELPAFVPAFRLYPNPTTDFVRIDLEIDALQQYQALVELYNAAGQRLIQQTASLYSGRNTVDVQLADLASGIYYINLRIGSEQIVRSLQVMR